MPALTSNGQKRRRERGVYPWGSEVVTTGAMTVEGHAPGGLLMSHVKAQARCTQKRVKPTNKREAFSNAIT